MAFFTSCVVVIGGICLIAGIVLLCSYIVSPIELKYIFSDGRIFIIGLLFGIFALTSCISPAVYKYGKGVMTTETKEIVQVDGHYTERVGKYGKLSLYVRENDGSIHPFYVDVNDYAIYISDNPRYEKLTEVVDWLCFREVKAKAYIYLPETAEVSDSGGDK